jgi:hypothetical protein
MGLGWGLRDTICIGDCRLRTRVSIKITGSGTITKVSKVVSDPELWRQFIQLLLTGVLTSLRRLFAKIRVNECNGDVSTATA